MITQNPIIGRARKKCAGIYARTLWGKNILQSCPPSTKGKQTPRQIETNNLFSKISRMAYQVSPSLLNQLFYEAPVGRSRRAEWMRQIAAGRQKLDGEWVFLPETIENLGGNLATCLEPFEVTPIGRQFTVNIANLSKTEIAITTEKPCVILMCQDTNTLISLIDYTTLTANQIQFENLTPTIIGHKCLLFTLWKYNAGSQQTPNHLYGSYKTNN